MSSDHWAYLTSTAETVYDPIYITRDKFTIGRSKAADLCLLSEKLVSARHCFIEKDSLGIAWIQDTSTHGTFLNKTRKLSGTKSKLSHGDEFYLVYRNSSTSIDVGYRFQDIETLRAAADAMLNSPSETDTSLTLDGMDSIAAQAEDDVSHETDKQEEPAALQQPALKRTRISSSTEDVKRPRQESAEDDVFSDENSGVSTGSTETTGSTQSTEEVTTCREAETSGTSDITTERRDAAEERTDYREDLLCGICRDIFYKCISLQPCMHSFCAGCYSVWMERSSDCPACRKEVERVNRNHLINSIAEKYLRDHPEHTRPEEELKMMDDKNKITNDMLNPPKPKRTMSETIDDELSDYVSDDDERFEDDFESELDEEDEEETTTTDFLCEECARARRETVISADSNRDGDDQAASSADSDDDNDKSACATTPADSKSSPTDDDITGECLEIMNLTAHMQESTTSSNTQPSASNTYLSEPGATSSNTQPSASNTYLSEPGPMSIYTQPSTSNTYLSEPGPMSIYTQPSTSNTYLSEPGPMNIYTQPSASNTYLSEPGATSSYTQPSASNTYISGAGEGEQDYSKELQESLQNLLKALKEKESDKTQEKVLQILKDNPKLMAAFIRHRQGKQIEERRYQSSPASNDCTDINRRVWPSYFNRPVARPVPVDLVCPPAIAPNFQVSEPVFQDRSNVMPQLNSPSVMQHQCSEMVDLQPQLPAWQPNVQCNLLTSAQQPIQTLENAAVPPVILQSNHYLYPPSQGNQVFDRTPFPCPSVSDMQALQQPMQLPVVSENMQPPLHATNTIPFLGDIQVNPSDMPIPCYPQDILPLPHAIPQPVISQHQETIANQPMMCTPSQSYQQSGDCNMLMQGRILPSEIALTLPPSNPNPSHNINAIPVIDSVCASQNSVMIGTSDTRCQSWEDGRPLLYALRDPGRNDLPPDNRPLTPIDELDRYIENLIVNKADSSDFTNI